MQDVFLYLPPALSSARPSSTPPLKSLNIVYFITGNPGLIAYYDTFLTLLSSHSSGPDAPPSRSAVIAGANLGGFFNEPAAAQPDPGDKHDTSVETLSVNDTAVTALKRSLLIPPHFAHKTIYSIHDQITLTESRINALVHGLREHFPTIVGQETPINVILAGHSVGAYIAIEVVRNRAETFRLARLSPDDPSTQQPKSRQTWHISCTILLTPTIIDIAHSTSGRIATPLLSWLPQFPTLVQLAASTVIGSLPVSWVKAAVRRVTGMKSEIAVEATVGFLGMRGAVRQALGMAGEEMREIRGGDGWGEEVWGAMKVVEGDPLKEAEDSKTEGRYRRRGGKETPMERAGGGVAEWKAPRHFFLFAREDHWVADVTRNAIVERMKERGEASVKVDGEEGKGLGLVHAWCLEQNEAVAEIVGKWIEEVLEQ